MYKIFTTRTPEFLGLDKIASTLPTTNKSIDIIVGLIDTGVWPESKSFDDTGYKSIPHTWKGKCEIGINFTTSNCNKKLIGARFFLKGYEASEGPINETIESRSPRDDDGHGTHTASTAAGSPVGNANFFGYTNGTARGMAVGARVAVYKACWQNGCTGLGTCLPDSLDPKKVSGKIVLCDRGENSRIEKGNIVKSAGGLGMVLANTDQFREATVADAHFMPAINSGHSVEEINYIRILTNVGVARTYKVSAKLDDPSVKVSIKPEVLSFKTNEKKLYTVTFTTSGSKPNNTRSFGRLEWSDGKNVVRSPIAFIWKLP
ncbi:hypothetical protein TSUD_224720 [Trifolium subterraneum]|uniref:Subtilisin-like protease fibronectin type-III domain-containing protein n=1 Tax=Trifolium subterraneum TaxID=3900 RepID=A0A2Z6MRM0_TRISU|nr:hypothetical protein TSUD_224720 [Trifolium subterraneum]